TGVTTFSLTIFAQTPRQIGYQCVVRPSDSGQQPILLYPNGERVGIRTMTPIQILHAVGNAYISGGGTSWATRSSAFST
ncbi:MAG TPA: hypothetical protein VN276_01125, partial [Bacteroidales bacterium]|nr:hypothetical protein [Bacteroidales bacterium]